MDNNENKKSKEARPDEARPDEALPDEALENVAGGGFKDWLKGIFDPTGIDSSDSLTGKGGPI